MIITTSGEPGVPARPVPRVLAAVDVEWSKNYRVPNGNVPFCYSVIWLAVPVSEPPSNLGRASVQLHVGLRGKPSGNPGPGRQR